VSCPGRCLTRRLNLPVLHASFREQARRARLAGDAVREAVCRAREERVQEILQEANHAALEHLQEHAGFTRTGYHGRRVDGVEPGRWACAGLVVTTWLQGTNRDGKPHDQAAMIYEGLTSRRRVSVGVGPAGSGKTHTVAAGAKAWEASGGKVVGLTCAQAARNVLHAAGIRKCFNTTKFLLEVQRGMPIGPGTLFVVDEGSMVSMAHPAQIIDLAERHGGKVFVTGDHEQLTAPQAGGGMTLLANHLGHTQLAVPVRFTQEWERDASLRLASRRLLVHDRSCAGCWLTWRARSPMVPR
jgi:hypothetical protein